MEHTFHMFKLFTKGNIDGGTRNGTQASGFQGNQSRQVNTAMITHLILIR